MNGQLDVYIVYQTKFSYFIDMYTYLNTCMHTIMNKHILVTLV